MRQLINFLMKINVWVIFFLSVAGAVLFSIFLGLLINYFFYDGAGNLLMLGAVVIPAIDAPIFIILLIISIKELRISREKLDQRVEERTRELESAYVQLSREIKEKKEIEKKLLHAHKMEAIGTLAGGIAHDFNNILSSVIGFTELSLDELDKDSLIADNLQEVYAAAIRAKELVKQILIFARQSEEETKPIRIDSIVKEVLKLLRSTIPTTIEIKSKIESRSSVMGDPINVHQILMNLCTNAFQAMEKGGTLSVDLEDVNIDKTGLSYDKKLAAGGYIKLTVSDTGAGIPDDIIESIFEPYFTTKPVGEGTGMGLAMVHGIVKKYHGEIFVKSAIGKGTVFAIFLPVTDKEDEIPLYRSESLPTGTEHILFIDDEFAIVSMGEQILRKLRYKVTTRTSSVEAIELFEERKDDFDLVVTDMTMPNMTGDELAMEIKKIRPDIPVILCTGYSRKISLKDAKNIGVDEFVYKPIVKADLAKTIRKVLDETKKRFLPAAPADGVVE